MKRGTLFRGQPVLLLASVCVGWVGLRIVLLGAADPAAAEALLPKGSPRLAQTAEALPQSLPALARQNDNGLAPSERAAAEGRLLWVATMPHGAGLSRFPAISFGRPPAASVPMRGEADIRAGDTAFRDSRALTDPAQAAGLTPPAERLIARPAPASAVVASLAASPRSKRWSGDGWVLLRDGGSASLNPGRPTYGRSQAGAVLRYRLDDGAGHRMQAYARVSGALAGGREQDGAVGVSGRPVAAVPVRLAAELRATDNAAGTHIRPSVYAVTELPPVALPFGAQGEAYVQAGYVTGSNATAFIDGQVRVDKSVIKTGPVEARVGGGMWGGAQEDSRRLDAGPSVVLRLPLGPVYTSLSADYRFRLAGNAAPASGPTLTLSAGF